MKLNEVAALSLVLVLLSVLPLAAQSDFIRGDCNGDGFFTVSDSVFAAYFRWQGGPEPECLAACEFDNTGMIEGQLR